MGHAVLQHMLVLHAYPDEWASDFSEELKIEAARDVIAPVAPTGLSATAVAEGARLEWTNPTLNVDGSACYDLSTIKVYYKASAGVTKASNDGSFLVGPGERFVDRTLAASATRYYVVTAIDATGNESDESSEAHATATSVSVSTSIPDDASDLIFDDTIGTDGVLTGDGVLGMIFLVPNTAWVNFDHYRLWYAVDTGGGFGGWTEIGQVSQWGFRHPNLTTTYAYKYKATVVATDGTESSTADEANNSGAGFTPNAADNSAIIAEVILAQLIIAIDEVRAENIKVTNLAAINADLGAITAGSININSGAFTVSAAGAVVCTNLTITGGSININSGVFTVSAAGAVVASSISCTNLAVGAGSSWGGNVLGMAYIPNLSATKITTDTMSANRISGGTIGACTISASYITADTMSAARISGGTIGACVINAGYLTAGTLNFAAISRSALSILESELGAGVVTSGKIGADAVIYGKIAANAVRTAELYVDGNINFKPGATSHSIFNITNLGFGTSVGANPQIFVLNNKLTVFSSGGLAITDSGGTALELISLDGGDISIESADDIILDVADAANPMYIHDWWAAGGAVGTAAGRILLTVDGNTRYLRLYT